MVTLAEFHKVTHLLLIDALEKPNSRPWWLHFLTDITYKIVLFTRLQTALVRVHCYYEKKKKNKSLPFLSTKTCIDQLLIVETPNYYNHIIHTAHRRYMYYNTTLEKRKTLTLIKPNTFCSTWCRMLRFLEQMSLVVKLKVNYVG